MTAYYAAHVHGSVVIVQSGPHATHDEAMQTHVRALELQAGPGSGYWERRVLLDVGSVDAADPELSRVLMTDPMLHAIYTLGLQRGRLRGELDEQNRRAAYVENPECCASGSCEVCTGQVRL